MPDWKAQRSFVCITFFNLKNILPTLRVPFDDSLTPLWSKVPFFLDIVSHFQPLDD
jgi:hypothetical protein